MQVVRTVVDSKTLLDAPIRSLASAGIGHGVTIVAWNLAAAGSSVPFDRNVNATGNFDRRTCLSTCWAINQPVGLLNGSRAAPSCIQMFTRRGGQPMPLLATRVIRLANFGKRQRRYSCLRIAAPAGPGYTGNPS